MSIVILPNGNIEMQLVSGEEVSRFSKEFPKNTRCASKTESRFMRTWLKAEGYAEILPEDCGALTSAPMIAKENEVWGFMSYQVDAFLEELALGNAVIWQKG